MKNYQAFFGTILLGCTLSLSAFSQDNPPEPEVMVIPAAKAGEEQLKKAGEWVASLELKDKEKEARLITLIADHLTAVRNWHNDHPFDIVPAGINPLTGLPLSDLDRQIIATSSKPKEIDARLLNGLKAELTPEQVEAILDKYTIGKVAFTMKGYQAIVPDLTEKESATIEGFLKQARLESIGYKNMKEISAIFEIYKTKSEQYLNNNGRNWRQMYKTYTDAVKAKKAADKKAAEKKSDK